MSITVYNHLFGAATPVYENVINIDSAAWLEEVLKGTNAVIMFYWQGCSHCHDAMPLFNEVAGANKNTKAYQVESEIYKVLKEKDMLKEIKSIPHFAKVMDGRLIAHLTGLIGHNPTDNDKIEAVEKLNKVFKGIDQ